ncbi:MAG: hypothetical protein U0V48_10345 [Anaerolineales bacterium]
MPAQHDTKLSGLFFSQIRSCSPPLSFVQPYRRPSTIIELVLLRDAQAYRHLDWRQPLEWLGNPFYWALGRGQSHHRRAGMSAEAAKHVLDPLVRFFGAVEFRKRMEFTMAHRARRDPPRGRRVAAIAMQPWFQQMLADSGFENRQNIVMLEWRYQPWVRKEAAGIRIRKMEEADLPAVEEIDAAAFIPLWQNPQATLRAAFSQALFASVAEEERGAVGYQITTGQRRVRISRVWRSTHRRRDAALPIT